MLELTGENFTPHLKVWFGEVEAETLHRSAAILPLILVFSSCKLLTHDCYVHCRDSSTSEVVHSDTHTYTYEQFLKMSVDLRLG